MYKETILLGPREPHLGLCSPLLALCKPTAGTVSAGLQTFETVLEPDQNTGEPLVCDPGSSQVAGGGMEKIS